MNLKSFEDCLEFLDNLKLETLKSPYGGESGLHKSKDFLRELVPDIDKQYNIIHVAGTSGKTSTCQLVSNLLTAHGYKVGLNISPHLKEFRERFQINSEMISKELFLKYLNELLLTLDAKNTWLSYFELLPVLAYYIFYKEKVDYVVIETGIGGRLDPSNIIDTKKVSVITNIGFDHMKLLGNTLDKIAKEKLGIVSHDNLVISGVTQSQLKPLISRFANAKGSAVVDTSIEDNWEDLLNKLSSETSKRQILKSFQLENIRLALRVVNALAIRDEFELDHELLIEEVLNFSLKGRIDSDSRNGNKVLLDVAHSEPKINALMAYVNSNYDQIPVILSDKSHKSVVQTLTKYKRMYKKLIFLEPKHGSFRSSLNKFFESSSGELVIVTGSFKIVRDYYSLDVTEI